MLKRYSKIGIGKNQVNHVWIDQIEIRTRLEELRRIGWIVREFEKWNIKRRIVKKTRRRIKKEVTT